jgi:hypothetical protein
MIIDLADRSGLASETPCRKTLGTRCLAQTTGLADGTRAVVARGQLSGDLHQ